MSGEFDRYAKDYGDTLNRGLRFSGEGPEYFAERRIECLRERLAVLGVSTEQALDFGCGTGTSGPLLLQRLRLKMVVGVDPSRESISKAREVHCTPGLQFSCLDEFRPDGAFGLAFCNGVFHHIPPGMERTKAVRMIHDSLRVGGIFSFWENNPWNPGTRFIMSRIPFDRDAVTLSVLEAKALLRAGGFEVLSVNFWFIFPRTLRWLRPLERVLSGVPLGGQYQVLCRK